MELYNFFSETISDTDQNMVKEFKRIVDDLKESCEFVTLIERNYPKSYTIVGQIYGDDTNAGDLELLSMFAGIAKYYWFVANQPTINNLEQK